MLIFRDIVTKAKVSFCDDGRVACLVLYLRVSRSFEVLSLGALKPFNRTTYWKSVFFFWGGWDWHVVGK